MKNYLLSSIFLTCLVFFSLGTLDKIIAQTKWDSFDLLFAFFTSCFAGITLYFYKNKL